VAECLLIDDSRLARRICRMMLEKLGHKVAEAEEGQEGLDSFAQHPFDFILVDQNMPVMGGLEFIQHMRKDALEVDVPIVLCSSDSDPILVRAALRHGANAYLNKPFTETALLRRLKRLQISV
jgi:two-component system chemotaxis response regulator CheY